MYKCPDCGYVSEEPGDCPMCHIPMIEEEEEDENKDSEDGGSEPV